MPYTRTQIWLHWIIAILIVLQLVSSDAISHAWDVIEEGQVPERTAMVAAHVFGGIAVLLLALWRLSLRLRVGAPPLPEQETALMKLATHATHWTLYALMIVVPLSGMAAWFGGIEAAAEGHEVLKTLLLLLVLLHFAAAMFHQFYLKTGLLARMKRPGTR